jgi:hypothetical protein
MQCGGLILSFFEPLEWPIHDDRTFANAAPLLRIATFKFQAYGRFRQPFGHCEAQTRSPLAAFCS